MQRFDFKENAAIYTAIDAIQYSTIAFQCSRYCGSRKVSGDNALAAVGSNTALINLLTNLFVGFSIGANVTAARHYGAKCEKDLEETVHTSIAMSFASGFLLMIVGLIGAKQFLIWMQIERCQR